MKSRMKFVAKYTALYGFLLSLVWFASTGVAGYRIALNVTSSVDGWVFLIDTNDKTIAKNKLVAVTVPDTPFYDHEPTFIKYVWGQSGDDVRFEPNGDFYINKEWKGVAKKYSLTGIKLEAAQGGIIPKGKFFGATPVKDSFDSRYQLIGNLDEHSVVGRAIRLI